ncbi:MAG: extracellular solute-binding protein [Oscillospiraceae bacterium]|nr:extracellular solute-binding protein [Oscillospiraceae bacterium]
MKRTITLCAALTIFLCTGCQRIPDTMPTHSDAPEETSAAQEPVPTDENGDILIRIATDETEYLPPELESAMEEFNLLDNGYHVKPVIYSKAVMGTDGSGGLQTADMRLLMDVMQGENVDVVMDYSFFDLSNYDILSEKGAFVDLYTFLDGDSGISRSELNAHVLEIHENDGKLYQMPLSYKIETMVGNAEYVGTKENWTMDEMIEKWEQAPEGTNFCGNSTQWPVYRSLVRSNMGAFVDYENGTCFFDSPEFIRLLEFVSQFTESKVKIEPDYNNNFVAPCIFYGFDNFHMSYHGDSYLREEHPVYVGYPTENGQGSFVDTLRKRYSICESAHPAVQEGAWEFFSYMLDADVQIKNCVSYDKDNFKQNPYFEENGFPINQTAFERIAEGMIAHAGTSRIMDFSGIDEDVSYLTQEEYERLLRLIDSLHRMDAPIDKVANTIIENEIEALFAGERTAEEAAKAIQGRMEIMISERS